MLLPKTQKRPQQEKNKRDSQTSQTSIKNKIIDDCHKKIGAHGKISKNTERIVAQDRE